MRGLHGEQLVCQARGPHGFSIELVGNNRPWVSAEPVTAADGAGRLRERQQELRRGPAGRPRTEPRDPGRPVRRARRAVRVRQDDRAAHGGRARGRHVGRDQHRRARRQPCAIARSRHRDGVPELRALPASERLRQHRVQPQAAGSEEARDRREGSRGGAGARSRGLPGAEAARAVRRTAAAGRHGQGDRARARRVPDGRAALEPRREAARADARGDRRAAALARRDDDLRHPRSDRGDDARATASRSCGRASCSRSTAQTCSTTARPTSSSAASSAARR